MDFFDAVVKLIDAVRPRRDGDVVDRLNYAFTTTILVICALFVATWSFVGNPIYCWYPAYFNGWWIEYANDYCFVQNTYFMPMRESKPLAHETAGTSRNQIPHNITAREDGILPYYQWVSIVLAMQAFSFFLPAVIWRSCNSASGLCTNTILTTAVAQENLDKDTRKTNMVRVAKFMDYINQVEGKLKRGSKARGCTFGCYVVSLYIFVKFLYFINAALQFVVLNNFLAFNDSRFWGYQILNDVINGRSWMESGRFPRVTLCDFQIRVLGNLHRHTVQCVLMINMFNEKFFVFLWFWFFFIAIATFASLCQWIYEALSYRYNRNKFIRHYVLKIPDLSNDFDTKSSRFDAVVDRFVTRSLHADGTFLVKLISANAGDVVTLDLINRLWDIYVNKNPGILPDDSFTIPTPPNSVRLAGRYKDINERTPTPDVMGRIPPTAPPPRYEDSVTDSASSRNTPSLQTEL